MSISRGLNQWLRGVPDEVWARLAPALELVSLGSGDVLGDVLHTLGRPWPYVYFPIDSSVSLLCTTADGNSAEIALVGREGMVGATAFLNGGYASHTWEVLCPGLAYRLKADLLRAELEQGGPLLKWLLRHMQVLATQITQSTACSRHHSIDQQWCRAVLMTLDRKSGNTLALTQELMARRLGVRRETISYAAGRLQQAGTVEYHRGLLTVLDRPALETMACECYAAVKHETDRLIGPEGAALG